MKNADIAVLVTKVLQNKKRYFEELYRETFRTVYYCCYKALGNEEDAKDATQQVFITLYEKLETLYHPNAFNKFLSTTTRYTCNDIRKAKFRTDAEDIDNYETALPEDNDDFLPAEAFANQELRQKIAKLIETLPEKQREAILLFYFEEKSIKEITEITDSKFDAVNNRLVTARKTLRVHAEELMAVVPVPILTQILQEEAGQVATPEICELAWQNIESTLNLPTTGGGSTAANQAAATATATTTTAVNIAIAATIVAVLAVGGFLAYYVYDNIINPYAAVMAPYENAPEADNNVLEFEPLILAITNRAEFVAFTDLHGFRFLGGYWTSYRGSQMLYFLEHHGNFIYLGYVEDLQEIFHVVYEISDNSAPRITTDDVAAWFLR